MLFITLIVKSPESVVVVLIITECYVEVCGGGGGGGVGLVIHLLSLL